MPASKRYVGQRVVQWANNKCLPSSDLVDDPSGKVEEVTWLQDGIQYGLTNIFLTEVLYERKDIFTDPRG